MTEIPLTALEVAVLREFCRQLPVPDCTSLEKQINHISVLSRENTGAGFYTYFGIPHEVVRPVKADLKSYVVNASINGVENALGFILWQENGYIDCLEGYTLALASTKNIDLAALQFELSSSASKSN